MEGECLGTFLYCFSHYFSGKSFFNLDLVTTDLLILKQYNEIMTLQKYQTLTDYAPVTFLNQIEIL